MDTIEQLLRDATRARRLAKYASDNLAQELVEVAEQLEKTAEHKARNVEAERRQGIEIRIRAEKKYALLQAAGQKNNGPPSSGRKATPTSAESCNEPDALCEAQHNALEETKSHRVGA
jgi:hypothetical protein